MKFFNIAIAVKKQYSLIFCCFANCRYKIIINTNSDCLLICNHHNIVVYLDPENNYFICFIYGSLFLLCIAAENAAKKLSLRFFICIFIFASTYKYIS